MKLILLFPPTNTAPRTGTSTWGHPTRSSTRSTPRCRRSARLRVVDAKIDTALSTLSSTPIVDGDLRFTHTPELVDAQSDPILVDAHPHVHIIEKVIHSLVDSDSHPDVVDVAPPRFSRSSTHSTPRRRREIRPHSVDAHPTFPSSTPRTPSLGRQSCYARGFGVIVVGKAGVCESSECCSNGVNLHRG